MHGRVRKTGLFETRSHPETQVARKPFFFRAPTTATAPPLHSTATAQQLHRHCTAPPPHSTATATATAQHRHRYRHCTAPPPHSTATARHRCRCARSGVCCVWDVDRRSAHVSRARFRISYVVGALARFCTTST